MNLVAEKMPLAADGRGADLLAALRQRYQKLTAEGITSPAFELRLPDGHCALIGAGEPRFTLNIATPRGLRAVASFDELRLAEAYMNGDLDIFGDMLASLKHRRLLSDRHPLKYLMATYLEPLFAGQVSSDKRWIKSHYDIDPEFFLLWLDKQIRGYSHAHFADDAEPLEVGMERKFRFAMDACGIRAGDRVLDIGGGWGSFLEYAGSQGVHVTSVTISDVSQKFMQEIIARKQLPCEVVKEHLLDYRSAAPFDAVVNLGVTEHLPDYRRTLRQYQRLLKPGGRIYLDAYSGDRHGMPSFITKWVYEGNTSPLCLPRYLAEVARTDFDVVLVQNDRHNYYLTCKKWAENLEAESSTVIARWGHHLYRRFRLYLWAAANSFELGTLSAHRMVMERRALA
ncbi:MAG: class I SAM-dependent methyltransferase [Blastocatellia bacterium]